ncbi:MAG: DUF2269 family protein [Pseudolysinimonas sp.]
MPLLLHVLHVVGAVFVIGPTAILPMFALRAIRRGDDEGLRGLTRSFLVFSIGSVVVAAIGFGVMSTGEPDDNWSMATPWIAGSIALFAVAALLNLAVVYPALRRITRVGGSESGSRLYPLIAGASGISALLLVAVVVLMVAQP